MNRQDVARLLEHFPHLRVAVIGDLMMDHYISGTATRISPEAPVPIVRVRQRKSVLGGAANVMRNLTSLGVPTVAFGVTGTDKGGDELMALCRQGGIDTSRIVRVADRRTTLKTRVIADRQQVVRIDEEDDEPLAADVAAELAERICGAIDRHEVQAVIIEDYNKGVITPDLARMIQQRASAAGVFTALDPHPGNPLNVTGLSLMTPNRAEAFALANVYHKSTVLPVTNDLPLAEVGSRLLATWQPEMLLVTLGAEGMAMIQPGQPIHHVPTVAREVFDVSGAGDTVIAAFTAAHLAGLGAHDAMVFANHAAGVVVGKVGTVPIEPADLLATFAE